MVECKYRIPVRKKGGRDGTRTVSAKLLDGGAVAGVGLIQRFQHGLCGFLTSRDIGPVECRQPNCSSANCPDIKPFLTTR